MPNLKQKLSHPILESALALTGFRQAAFNTFGSLVLFKATPEDDYQNPDIYSVSIYTSC
jgi:hypothetical protein